MVRSLVVLLSGAGLTFLATWYWTNQRKALELRVQVQAAQDAKNQQIFDRLVDLEKQSALLQQLVGPLSTAFQAALVKELTHFHTPEMDALMVKLGPPYVLNDDELGRLTVMLRERANSSDLDIPESEREAALMLPYVLKRAKREAVTLQSLGLIVVPVNKVQSV